jgi:hypothetical protein
MALSVNQGYVRRFNLSETIDGVKSINNLAGGSISTDLSIFSGNTKNTSSIIYKVNEPGFSITNENTFTFDLISCYGNGDKVRVKAARKITDLQYNVSTDVLTLQFDIGHGITSSQIAITQTLRIEDSFFGGGVAEFFNGKDFRILSVPTTTSLNVTSTGYSDVFKENSPLGSFDPTDRYPYCLCELFTLPSPLAYSQDYFIAFSNNINEFKLTSFYERTKLVFPISISTTPTIDYPIVFVRDNSVTQDNILNLVKPRFEDTDGGTGPVYGFGILDSTFNENFDRLESILDSGNFFKSKKYVRSLSNTFNENPIKLEGALRTIDPDNFISGTEELFFDASPGVFIIDPSSSLDNVTKLRSFSDNSSPWELNGGVLEYSAATISDPTQQEASIGNLILGDASATGCITIEEIQDLYRSGSIPENATDFDPENPSLPVGRYILFPAGIAAKFTHKLPVIINGEEYNILLAEAST